MGDYLTGNETMPRCSKCGKEKQLTTKNGAIIAYCPKCDKKKTEK